MRRPLFEIGDELVEGDWSLEDVEAEADLQDVAGEEKRLREIEE